MASLPWAVASYVPGFARLRSGSGGQEPLIHVSSTASNSIFAVYHCLLNYPKHNPGWAARFDLGVLRVLQGGLYSHWWDAMLRVFRNMYLRGEIERPPPPGEALTEDKPAVSAMGLGDLGQVFAAGAILLVLAGLVFVGEMYSNTRAQHLFPKPDTPPNQQYFKSQLF